MKTATLGKTGSQITRLGMGGWQASGSGAWGAGPRSDDRDAVAAIRRAVERGVTWVDTAASYGLGHSEENVARALEPGGSARRCWSFPSAVIRGSRPTGSGPTSPLLDPARVRGKPATARRRARRPLPVPPSRPETPVEASWGTLAELVDEGRCDGPVVSNFDVDLLDRCEAIRHVDSLQPELSLLRREALSDVIPWCGAHQTGVIAYSPMATGALSGAYDAGRLEELPADDWRRASSTR